MFTYYLTSKGMSFILVTGNLETRILAHKAGIGSEFTSKYNCYYLMYVENFDNINVGIKREKQLKNWHRDWKINLIKDRNNVMEDLAKDWFTEYDIKNAKEIQ